MAVRKGKGTTTRGIKTLGNGVYKIRARKWCPLKGRQIEMERKIEGATLAEARALKERLERKLETQIGAGYSDERRRLDTVPENFSALVVRWLRGAKVTKKWTPNTQSRYATALDNHLLPHFGDMPLASITVTEVEDWRDEKAEDYTGETVNGWLRILRTVLNRAVAAGWLRLNPATATEACASSKKKRSRLKLDELVQFVHQARRTATEEQYAMVMVLATTGMRIQCLLPLKWTDIEDEIIVVQRRLSGPKVIPGVKRGADEYDRVPLELVTAEALQKWRLLCEAECSLSDSEWIFPSSRTGGLQSRNCLAEPIRDICRAAGLRDDITPHSFRCSVADIIGSVGGRRVAKEFVGHATDQMFDRYTEIDDAQKIEASRSAFQILQENPRAPR